MGGKHQIFLIARVVPHELHCSGEARYCCVGVFDHQWCYGRLPLRATRRLLNLFKNEDNAEIIREELHAIQGKYARPGAAPVLIAHLDRAIYLLENQGDREEICQELEASLGKDGAVPAMPDIPCPYTTFLAASAWCVDIENLAEPYASGVFFKNSVSGRFGGGRWRLSYETLSKDSIHFRQ